MKTVFVVLGVGLLILGVTFGLSLAFNGMDSTNRAIFAPINANIDRKTYENSASYNDGMVRDLENLKLEYLKANDDQKAALRATILHRFSVYPYNRLTPDLQNFYDSLTH